MGQPQQYKTELGFGAKGFCSFPREQVQFPCPFVSQLAEVFHYIHYIFISIYFIYL